MSVMQIECPSSTDEVQLPLGETAIPSLPKNTASPDNNRQPLPGEHSKQLICDTIQRVKDAIAPVWPLKNYVAVNPYQGLSDRSFLDARTLLRSVSDCEVLMPLEYFQTKYQQGDFELCDLEAAVNDVSASDASLNIQLDEVVAVATGTPVASSKVHAANAERHIRSIAELADESGNSEWTEVIREEIGRHLSAHYDEGQAVWQNPWKDLPLFQAWQSSAQTSRRLEKMGLRNFCKFIKSLPGTAEASIAVALDKLGVPEEQRESFLLCQAHSIPGWSAWTKYKQQQSQDESVNDFVSLLAIRLTYDVAILEHSKVNVDWNSASLTKPSLEANALNETDKEVALRFVLLRAAERAFERKLIESLGDQAEATADSAETSQPLAQMVFCIDVRSERYRRNLEATSSAIQTFGFAGFFGIPIAYQALGETSASPQLPALLSPQFTMTETIRGASPAQESDAIADRGFRRSLRKMWKQFQTSAVGCFGFVEATGLGFGWKLWSKSTGHQTVDPHLDGISEDHQSKRGPDIGQLTQLGLSIDQQVDMAESILRGIGITKDFAKLVVLCGHGSTVQNNPLQAGLDCGACCGHSGEPNARIAAMLLNQLEVQSELSKRGISVPAETQFVAAVHDTTSDSVSYFDTDLLTADQLKSLSQLEDYTGQATGQCQIERMPHLAANSVADVLKRSADWSEVRPEWGLAGNAAFIVAPRSMSDKANLDGRSFLHSYNFRNDPESKVLEAIMTAPMVVAHWINMQYYASSVDNQHYGSGSKTIHNVVGKFGVFAGNGGDLTTGLPLQSVHNGTKLQHDPLRLLSVIAAPRDAVSAIIQRHKTVEDLLVNNWLNLIVFDEGEWYRFGPESTWKPLNTAS